MQNIFRRPKERCYLRDIGVDDMILLYWTSKQIRVANNAMHLRIVSLPRNPFCLNGYEIVFCYHSVRVLGVEYNFSTLIYYSVGEWCEAYDCHHIFDIVKARKGGVCT
jgi:hypothetical protein